MARKALLRRVEPKLGRPGYSFEYEGRLHFAQPHRHGIEQWWIVWRVKEGESIDDPNSLERPDESVFGRYAEYMNLRELREHLRDMREDNKK